MDIVKVLTQAPDFQTARKSWNKLKERFGQEGSHLVTLCRRFKSSADDGKMRLTDVATAETLLRLVHGIPRTPVPPGGQSRQNHGKSDQKPRKYVNWCAPHLFEFRPQVEWNKGFAMQRILRRVNLPEDAAVFLGDDATDEDVFRELGPTAITVHVGSPTAPNHARLNAHDPADAVHFLDALASFFGNP